LKTAAVDVKRRRKEEKAKEKRKEPWEEQRCKNGENRGRMDGWMEGR